MTPSSRQPPARAGILVTGTEVLTGIISDRNGPWLSERLRELGVDTAMIQIVGDRPEDLLDSLEYMKRQGMAVIVTSGGLGPTADDLTAEVVGRFSGREMVLDARLEELIAEILRPMMERWPGLDLDAIRDSNRKQAVIPAGATPLDPVGTAPGLVVPPVEGQEGPTVVVLPGPPRELQPMWSTAIATDAFRAAIRDATTYRNGIVRLFGIPESEIANTLRAAEADGLSLEPLEITTCLRRGEIEIATRYEPAAQDAYDRLIAFITARHRDTLFSHDGTTIDEQVASLLTRAGCDRRSGRVVHRWPDGGSVDRPGRLLGIFPGRGRGVLERSEELARRGRPSPHRTRRRGVHRGCRGPRRRCHRPVRRGHRDRDHGHRRTGRRHGGEAGRHGLLLRGGSGRGSDHAPGAAPRQPRRHP